MSDLQDSRNIRRTLRSRITGLSPRYSARSMTYGITGNTGKEKLWQPAA
jgi:hypothetical protein